MKIDYLKVWLVFILMMFAMASAESSDHEHESHDSHDDHGDHRDHGSHDKSTSTMLQALGITTFSGCAAMLGFLFIFCLKKDQTAFIPISLGFSGGIIVYLTFMNLIPEGKEQFHHSMDEESEATAHFYNLLCIIGGLMLSLSMEHIIPHSHAHEHPAAQAASVAKRRVQNADLEMGEMLSPKCDVCDPEDPPLPRTNNNGTEMDTALQSELTLPRISYSVAAALILHHLPEGMCVFISLYHDMNFGLLVAFALGFHDIPSGVCIALPLFLTTGSKMVPFLMCLLAAFAYFLGGILGWVVIAAATDQFAESFIGVLFGLTSGVMLYVAFVEILPAALSAANHIRAQCECERKAHYDRVYSATIVSIFAGFLVMDISNILLAESGGHSH